MTLGENIQILRRQKGLSQEQLAEQLDVTRQTISKWELNQSAPEVSYLCQLSEIFGITLDVLVKGGEMPNEGVASEPVAKRRKKKKALPIVLAVCSVLLLALSGYGLYQLNQPPIIGGADGPTGILVVPTVSSYIPLFVITGILCAVTLLVLRKYWKHRDQ